MTALTAADTFRERANRIKNKTVRGYSNLLRAGVGLTSTVGLYQEGNLLDFSFSRNRSLVETNSGNVASLKQLTLGGLGIDFSARSEDFDEMYGQEGVNGLERKVSVTYDTGVYTLLAGSSDTHLNIPTTADISALVAGKLIDVPLGSNSNDLVSVSKRVLSFVTVGSGASEVVSLALVNSLDQVPYIGQAARPVASHSFKDGGSFMPSRTYLMNVTCNDNSFCAIKLHNVKLREGNEIMGNPADSNAAIEKTYALLPIKNTDSVTGASSPDFAERVEMPGTFGDFD